jgi:hypothetical protein
VRLRSFKLRLQDQHVRIVPATDASGCPFAGPGVDLRGEAAERAIAVARPLLDVLRSIEPGIEIRSLALDLERPRVTATLHPTTPEADARPRVVRLDEGPWTRAMVDVAGPLLELLAAEAARAIAARAIEP